MFSCIKSPVSPRIPVPPCSPVSVEPRSPISKQPCSLASSRSSVPPPCSPVSVVPPKVTHGSKFVFSHNGSFTIDGVPCRRPQEMVSLPDGAYIVRDSDGRIRRFAQSQKHSGDNKDNIDYKQTAEISDCLASSFVINPFNNKLVVVKPSRELQIRNLETLAFEREIKIENPTCPCRIACSQKGEIAVCRMDKGITILDCKYEPIKTIDWTQRCLIDVKWSPLGLSLFYRKDDFNTAVDIINPETGAIVKSGLILGQICNICVHTNGNFIVSDAADRKNSSHFVRVLNFNKIDNRDYFEVVDTLGDRRESKRKGEFTSPSAMCVDDCGVLVVADCLEHCRRNTDTYSNRHMISTTRFQFFSFQ